MSNNIILVLHDLGAEWATVDKQQVYDVSFQLVENFIDIMNEIHLQEKPEIFIRLTQIIRDLKCQCVCLSSQTPFQLKYKYEKYYSYVTDVMINVGDKNSHDTHVTWEHDLELKNVYPKKLLYLINSLLRDAFKHLFLQFIMADHDQKRLLQVYAKMHVNIHKILTVCENNILTCYHKSPNFDTMGMLSYVREVKVLSNEKTI